MMGSRVKMITQKLARGKKIRLKPRAKNLTRLKRKRTARKESRPV
jgi:hypothetical protein